MLKRNVIANYIGQGWAAFISVALIPVYISSLGIESYGLIGLYAVLQAWLNVLDAGMTPTLSREMSRFLGGGVDGFLTRNLLRSFEIITFVLAFLIAGIIYFSSGWIATHWLHAETLPVSVVSEAFSVMGLVTSLRFMEGVYRSSIVGLQRQLFLNISSSIMITLRSVGAVIVINLISPTITAFFLWQAIVSVINLVIYRYFTYSMMPGGMHGANFSIVAIKDVWRFASGMFGVTVVTLIISQIDKVILARVLSLADYGYYSMAAVVGTSIYALISPVSQAFYPRLCELFTMNDHDGFSLAYHKGAQLISVIAGSAGVVLIFYSEIFLRIWTNNVDISREVSPLLKILVMGNLINGLMYMPYLAQLASGWTSLSLKINIISAFLIVPMIYVFTPVYGGIGAAWVMVVLNLAYIFIGVQFMFHRILINEKLKWYLQDIFLPIAASLVSTCFIRWLSLGHEVEIKHPIALLIIASISALGMATLFANKIRLIVKNMFIKYALTS